jgi:hypothetical protein
LDALQRKMLRRIIGWRRFPHASWRDTMKRMNDRLNDAHHLVPWKTWTMKLARDQWRFVNHLISGSTGLWSRVLCKFNWDIHPDPTTAYQPYRFPGHPRQRWDDNIHRFCSFIWPGSRDVHWFDILKHIDMHKFEDDFVIFMCT